MMVRWMCGVSLNYRSCNVDLYSQSMADVMRHDRLKWFGHMERKGVDD